MQPGDFIVTCGALKIYFEEAHGVLPAKVEIRNYEGRYENVFLPGSCQFSVRTPDNRIVYPVASSIVKKEQHEDMDKIIFQDLIFRDAAGKVEEDFYGNISYEFYSDGTMFSNIYFIVASCRSPQLKDLKLAVKPDTQEFDDVRWAYFHRIEKIDGALIQDQSPKRFLPRNEKLSFPEVAPMISFNCFRTGAESRYLEFFVEGGATLSGKRNVTETTVTWDKNDPEIEWNFQTVPVIKEKLPMQFHNHWGWVIKHPDLSRQKPPFAMYHIQNSKQHYPTLNELKAMKDSSCDVVTLHEQWRYDVQNDGIPFDEKLFVETVKNAHDLGMRVAVYMRGNENSVVEDYCEWFDRYLKKDFDGLYMDYGSPYAHTTAPNEFSQHGRVHFRKSYQLFRALRQRVGKEGLFYSHTGPSYSGANMSIFDGYVSGEGERGLLIRSRKHHEYFSMAAVSNGTMWTAAFPEYLTDKMTPFLAATGQYPHAPLGPASHSSSLTHPSEPGINDKAVRPLWKLWGLFRQERDIQIRNDYNCRKVFSPDEDCGHFLMFTAGGQKALYIIGNFASETRTFDVTPQWANSGFSPSGKKCFLLTPDTGSPGKARLYTEEKLSVTLKSNGIAGFFFTTQEADFSEYMRPYHKVCDSGVQYLEEVAEQKRFREEPPLWDKTILTVRLPAPRRAAGYEDSLLLDLFDNDSYLVKFAPDGTFTKLAKIVREDGKSLFTGDESIPIVLNDLLPAGEHFLAIYATYHGTAFYSFFDAVVSNGEGESYTLLYRNDLEKDRSFIHFKVRLK